MEQVCVEGVSAYIGIATAVVAGASVIANFVSKESVLGKIVSFLALNIKVK